MKYEEIVAKVKKAYAKADTALVDEHLAVQRSLLSLKARRNLAQKLSQAMFTFHVTLIRLQYSI